METAVNRASDALSTFLRDSGDSAPGSARRPVCGYSRASSEDQEAAIDASILRALMEEATRQNLDPLAVSDAADRMATASVITGIENQPLRDFLTNTEPPIADPRDLVSADFDATCRRSSPTVLKRMDAAVGTAHNGGLVGVVITTRLGNRPNAADLRATIGGPMKSRQARAKAAVKFMDLLMLLHTTTRGQLAARFNLGSTPHVSLRKVLLDAHSTGDIKSCLRDSEIPPPPSVLRDRPEALDSWEVAEWLSADAALSLTVKESAVYQSYLAYSAAALAASVGCAPPGTDDACDLRAFTICERTKVKLVLSDFRASDIMARMGVVTDEDIKRYAADEGVRGAVAAGMLVRQYAKRRARCGTADPLSMARAGSSTAFRNLRAWVSTQPDIAELRAFTNGTIFISDQRVLELCAAVQAAYDKRWKESTNQMTFKDVLWMASIPPMGKTLPRAPTKSRSRSNLTAHTVGLSTTSFTRFARITSFLGASTDAAATTSVAVAAVTERLTEKDTSAVLPDGTVIQERTAVVEAEAVTVQLTEVPADSPLVSGDYYEAVRCPPAPVATLEYEGEDEDEEEEEKEALKRLVVRAEKPPRRAPSGAAPRPGGNAAVVAKVRARESIVETTITPTEVDVSREAIENLFISAAWRNHMTRQRATYASNYPGSASANVLTDHAVFIALLKEVEPNLPFVSGAISGVGLGVSVSVYQRRVAEAVNKIQYRLVSEERQRLIKLTIADEAENTQCSAYIPRAGNPHAYFGDSGSDEGADSSSQEDGFCTSNSLDYEYTSDDEDWY